MTRTTPDPLTADLAGVIDQTLGGLLPPGQGCALLDYPGHSNVGDSAIWLGERTWLRRMGIPVNYACDALTYSEHRLRRQVGSGTILIHGGGNFGDLWPRHQEFREAVVSAFPRNRIIQLPQTIWFREPMNLARTRDVFDRHPDLTILLRDPQSLETAQNSFRARSLLCPDMAFALGLEPRTAAPVRELVCLLRQDIESVAHASEAAGLRASSVDWLGDQHSLRLLVSRFLVEQRSRHPRIAERCSPLLAPFYPGLWDGLSRERVRRGCNLLGQARVVITDRLHGHILSLLLGIPHVVLDNSYGKVRSFYDTWTKSSDLAHWANSPAEAATLARQLLDTSR